MFWYALKKELSLLWRDKGNVASLFVMPLAFLVLLGAVFETGDTTQKAGLSLVAQGPTGDMITQALEAADAFNLSPDETPETAREHLRRGDVDAILTVPEALDIDAPGVLQFDENAPWMVRSPIEAIVKAVFARLAGGQACRISDGDIPLRTQIGGAADTAKPITITEARGFQISVPGNVVLFAFFVAVTLGISLIEERRSGTWVRILSAPRPPWVALLTKVVPYGLVGLVQIAFLFGVGILVFGLEIKGSWTGLALVSLATVFCALGLGLLLATFGRSEKSVGTLASVTLLVLGMLGGAMIPRQLLPKAVQVIGGYTPHGWALDAYHDLVLNRQTTLVDILPNAGALAACGACLMLLGLYRFRSKS